jgi:hypothetical protein
MEIDTIEQGLDILKKNHNEYIGAYFTIHWAKRYNFWTVSLAGIVKSFSDEDLIVAISKAIKYSETRKRIDEKGIKTFFKQQVSKNCQ